MLLAAVAGGDSPHSSSCRRSVETTSLACSSRIASSARCLPAPSASERVALDDLQWSEQPEFHAVCAGLSRTYRPRSTGVYRDAPCGSTGRAHSPTHRPHPAVTTRKDRTVFRSRFTRSAGIALAVTALGASTAAAQPADLRTPDAIDAGHAGRPDHDSDLRTPDAVDAGTPASRPTTDRRQPTCAPRTPSTTASAAAPSAPPTSPSSRSSTRRRPHRLRLGRRGHRRRRPARPRS